MNAIKDDWEDDDEDETLTQAEQLKLDSRKKEEEADHALTEDLFAANKQTKPAVATKTQSNHLPPKSKPKEHASKKDENERNIHR